MIDADRCPNGPVVCEDCGWRCVPSALTRYPAAGVAVMSAPKRITLLYADERLAFPRQHSGDTPQIEYVRADLADALVEALLTIAARCTGAHDGNSVFVNKTALDALAAYVETEQTRLKGETT